jgi:hypothetical protein
MSLLALTPESSVPNPEPNSVTDSTRQLCASVFRDGSLRAAIRELVEDDLHAAAPELGLDLPLVASVSAYAESRQFRFDLLFGLLGTFGLLIASLWIPAALVLWITLPILWFRKFYQDRYVIPLEYFSHATFERGKVLQRFGTRRRHVGGKDSSPEKANVIVYSGFSPFVGAGLGLGGWSFAVDASRAKPDCTSSPRTFTVRELYNAVEDAIRGLKLDNLSIEDSLLIRGRDLSRVNWVFPNGNSIPRWQAEAAVVEQYVGGSDRVVRHYKWVRILDWSGEMVVSYFLRFSTCAASLFVEGNLLLLTPLKEKYRKVDRIKRPSRLQAAAICTGLILVGGLLLALFSLMRLLGRLAEEYRHWTHVRRERSEAQHDPEFDFGRASSLRERLAQAAYSHHFQKLDKEMYVKIVEKRLLDAIIGFLDDHQVDTSDLREQKTTIINSGLIVHGLVSAGAVAVGPKAAARFETSRAAAEKAA